MKTDTNQEIKLCLKARFPLIWVVSPEERLVEESLAAIAQDTKSQIYFWDYSRGWQHDPENSDKGNPMSALGKVGIFDKNQSCLVVFKDIANLIKTGGGNYQPQQLAIVRELKNLCKELEGKRVTLVLITSTLQIPTEITQETAVVEFGYPGISEIYELITGLVPASKLKLRDEPLDQLVRSCQGLSRAKIVQVLRKCLTKNKVDQDAIALMIAQKHETVKQTGILEFLQPNIHINNIGGLDNLKYWIQVRRDAFGQQAREYGLPQPKGLFLFGIPGTGKSLVAKAIAGYFNLPLLRLDIGRLFSGLVGESEAKTREMISLVEAIAPCCLLLDEFEKAFSNSGGDGGTSSRVLGTLLTWMQEKTSPVFIIATANRIENLPPESLRKGRYDELFFLDLPTQRERARIFYVHLSKVRPQSEIAKFDCNLLAEKALDFSGAEIEQCVIDAMYQGFSEGREFEQGDVLGAIASTVPLASVAQHQIKALHNWAVSNGVKSASLNNNDWQKMLENALRK